MRPTYTERYRSVAPTTYLASLDSFKADYFIEHNEHDSKIREILEEVSDFLELELNQQWRSQTWVETYCSWQGIFYPSVYPISAVSISYYDSDNDSQTVDADDIDTAVRSHVPKIGFATSFSFPSVYSRHDAITLTLTCGGTIPASVRRMAKGMAAAMYRYPETWTTENLRENPAYCRVGFVNRRGLIG